MHNRTIDLAYKYELMECPYLDYIFWFLYFLENYFEFFFSLNTIGDKNYGTCTPFHFLNVDCKSE